MARHRSRTGAPLDGASVEEVGRNHPSSHSESSAAYRLEFSRPLSDWLAEQRPLSTTGRLLDFGCADLLLARRLDELWVVDGYDEWASAREAARATLARLARPGQVFDALGAVPAGAYDAVVLNSLFQYVPDAVAAEALLAPIVPLLAPSPSVGIVITDVVSDGASPAVDLLDAVRYAVEREGIWRAPARTWEGIQSGKPAKRHRMPQAELERAARRLGLVVERHPRNLSRFTRRATFVLRPAPAPAA